MEYMVLIFEDEAAREKAPKAAVEQMFEAYGAYSAALVEKGAMRSGNALQPSSAATTVRLRDGARQTADGPHHADGEQLAGYYVIDCKDLDEALDWAAKVPSAPYGTIEVRPILNMG